MSWISVDESLPPFRERVLVWRSEKVFRLLCLYPEGFQGGGEVWSWAGVSQDKDIKYWQKLPDFSRK